MTSAIYCCRHRLFRSSARAVFVLALLVLCASNSRVAYAEQSQAERVARIKAAIVYYVAKFVKLPDEIKKPVTRPVVCCPIEDSLLLSALERTLNGKQVRGRPFQIEQISKDELNKLGMEGPTCDLLVLTQSEADELAPVLQSERANSVLSICEAEKPEWGRCLVQIFEEKNKARIAFDLEWAKKIGLSVSSELLSLSVVRTPKD